MLAWFVRIMRSQPKCPEMWIFKSLLIHATHTKPTRLPATSAKCYDRSLKPLLVAIWLALYASDPFMFNDKACNLHAGHPQMQWVLNDLQTSFMCGDFVWFPVNVTLLLRCGKAWADARSDSGTLNVIAFCHWLDGGYIFKISRNGSVGLQKLNN